MLDVGRRPLRVRLSRPDVRRVTGKTHSPAARSALAFATGWAADASIAVYVGSRAGAASETPEGPRLRVETPGPSITRPERHYRHLPRVWRKAQRPPHGLRILATQDTGLTH